MNINKTRKEELIKMDYGELQSTEEYKHYVQNYIYNKSKLINEIEYILNRSYEDNEAPLKWDDVTNQTYYRWEDIKTDLEEEIINDDERTKEEIINLKQELNELILNEDINDLENWAINNLLTSEFSDYEEQQEIYQWFIMDERIINQLEERGEPTLESKYWGRTSFGQALEMDGVIIEIFKEWFLNLYGVVEE